MCINHFQLWSSAATNGAPKRRRCIYPGCTRYRFKNHMCRFHNARHATSKRNEDGELSLFCNLISVPFHLKLIYCMLIDRY